MPKEFKQILEEQKAKEELEKYDIYTVNDETLRQVQDADKRKAYRRIDDVDAYIDRYR